MKTIVLFKADYDIDKIITWCHLNLGNGAQFITPGHIGQYPHFVWGYSMDFIDIIFMFKNEEDYVRFALTWIG